MIRIKGKKDYLVALESVAMTDIVLNMFIFFFISFSLLYTFSAARMSKVEVRLPKASTAVALEGAEKVVLAVTRQGEYYINDEKIRPNGLRAALASRVRENPDAGVLLKVDGSAKFSGVVTALDIVNDLRIQKVSIGAVKSNSK